MELQLIERRLLATSSRVCWTQPIYLSGQRWLLESTLSAVACVIKIYLLCYPQLILHKHYFCPKWNQKTTYSRSLLRCWINIYQKNRSVNLMMYAESPRAILDLPEICRAAGHLAQSYAFMPVGLVFGSDDLCASLGAARSVDGAEILYARQRLVLVAKAFGLQAIDMVHIQFKDLDSLREQSVAGAGLGYTGKQVIHPNQIETVQRAFMPTPEKVQWARELVEGFHLSQQEGKGAFVFAGSMVDMPLLRQAENILRISKIDNEV